jgi:hypothetical protein
VFASFRLFAVGKHSGKEIELNFYYCGGGFGWSSYEFSYWL